MFNFPSGEFAYIMCISNCNRPYIHLTMQINSGTREVSGLAGDWVAVCEDHHLPSFLNYKSWHTDLLTQRLLGCRLLTCILTYKCPSQIEALVSVLLSGTIQQLFTKLSLRARFHMKENDFHSLLKIGTSRTDG